MNESLFSTLYSVIVNINKTQYKQTNLSVSVSESKHKQYFSSVFTREDISILPVLETKFEGREFDYLGQLIVTPTMVAMKIRDMKDNKSPGVDGIPAKLLLEIVEQISIPLATVFNLSLEEGIVLLEWKEANIIPLLLMV